MKTATLLRPVKHLILLAVPFLVVASCKKEKDTNGSMNVWMCYGACSWKKMDMDLRSFDIHYLDETQGDKGWVTVESRAGTYDVVALTSATGSKLAQDQELPLGKIDKIRLNIGSQHMGITAEEDTVYLMTTSQALKTEVSLVTEITTDRTLDVQVGMNPEKSIRLSESVYYLAPSLQLDRIGYRD